MASYTVSLVFGTSNEDGGWTGGKVLQGRTENTGGAGVISGGCPCSYLLNGREPACIVSVKCLISCPLSERRESVGRLGGSDGLPGK